MWIIWYEGDWNDGVKGRNDFTIVSTSTFGPWIGMMWYDSPDFSFLTSLLTWSDFPIPDFSEITSLNDRLYNIATE